MLRLGKLLKLGVIAGAAVYSATAMAEVFIVDQHNKSFERDGKKIEKLAIKAGDTVQFKNEDPFFHNIFSLSDLKTFDLGSFPKGEYKEVVFDKAGVVEVECAIHPEMYLEVTVIK